MPVDGFGPESLGHRVPAIAVPTIAAVVYLDAPRGTLEALMAWRAEGRGKQGRRELVVRVVEVDGRWEETIVQEPAAPPPQPQPRLVLRRDGIAGILGSIKLWLGRA